MSADTLTVLRCEPGKRGAKMVRACLTPDGPGVVVDNFDAGRWFSVHPRPVDSLATLATTLYRVALDPRAFLVRGEPLPETDLFR